MANLENLYSSEIDDIIGDENINDLVVDLAKLMLNSGLFSTGDLTSYCILDVQDNSLSYQKVCRKL